MLTACADGVNLADAFGVLQDSGDGGGESVSAHVVFRDAVGVVGQDVAAVFAEMEAGTIQGRMVLDMKHQCACGHHH